MFLSTLVLLNCFDYFPLFYVMLPLVLRSFSFFFTLLYVYVIVTAGAAVVQFPALAHASYDV
jgi:hypothetical protein